MTVPYAAARSTAVLTLPTPRVVRDVRGRAVYYTRISDDTEGRELGVTRQGEDARALIDRNGWTLATDATGSVAGEYRDNDLGASTRSKKSRPAFAAMLAAVNAGEVDVIVAYSASRITRRMSEWLDLIKLVERTGVRIETVVSGKVDVNTADGRMMLQIMASIDQGEAERTAERIARAHRQRATAGMPNWRSRPFGHDVLRELDARGKSVVTGIIKVDREADALTFLVDQILDHGWTLARAARWLDDNGVSTTTGQLWTGPVARGNGGGILLGSVLRQARLAGILVHNGAEVGVSPHIPVIIPERRWRALVGKLNARAAKSSNTGRVAGGGARHGVHPLTGKAGIGRCEICNGPLTVANLPTVTGDNTSKMPFYKCKVGHVVVRADLVDRELMMRATHAGIESGTSVLPGDSRPDTSAEERRLTEVTDELTIWRGALVPASDGRRYATIEGQRVPVSLLTVAGEISRLEAEQAALQDAIKVADATVTSTGDVEIDAWDDLDPDELREAVGRVYSSVTLLRRYDDQADDTERVVTTFRETFHAEARPVVGYVLCSIKQGQAGQRSGWKVVGGHSEAPAALKAAA